MTRADRLVIAALVLASVLASPMAAAHEARSCGAPVAVVRGPQGTVRVPLDVDATYSVRGLRGKMTIRVDDGSIAVIGSSCRDRVCIRSGRISRGGQAIACIPNGVTVSVESEEQEFDAIVR